MKKVNSIEINVDVNNNQFEVNEKHETGPIEMIKIISLIIGEYNLMLVNDSNNIDTIDLLSNDFNKVIERVASLGKVSLKIDLYEPNTYMIREEEIYELVYNKDYSAVDIFSVLMLVLEFIKDSLLDSFALNSDIEMKSRAKGISELNQFKKTLEYIEGLSSILSMVGYVYRKKRSVNMNFSEDLCIDIKKLSSISDKMLDEALEKRKNLNDIDEKEKYRFDSLVEFKKSQVSKESRCHEHNHSSCSCHNHGMDNLHRRKN